ncbi:hypothetical protein N8083_01355 [Candidatus Pacebacteria bacterium]|nr:hypothetical protein [Candidatus Paceibacterota bacterium]
MSISKDAADEFKRIHKEKHGVELSDQEAQEAGGNLTQLAEILLDMSFEEQKRKNRLKEEPKGFPVDGHYTCIVCYRSIDETTGWYDHNNQKCLSCQKAVEEGTLPTFVCHHRASFFLMWELTSKFEIKSPTARKYVRQGELVARITPDGEHIFLKKENPRLYERYTAVRKSYDRNRKKVSERWASKMKEELPEEMNSGRFQKSG